MIPMMHKICHELKTHSTKISKDSTEIDSKQLFSLLAFEMIMTTGFGLEVNSWNDEGNVVKKMVWQYMGLAGNTTKMMIKFMFLLFFPYLAEKLKMRFIDQESEDFLVSLMKQTIQQRKSGQVPKRNDLVDLLIQAMDNSQDGKSDSVLAKMTDEEKELIMISQALVMFIAGFDTTSTSLSLVFHYLATNPECQEKLLDEINGAIDDNDGNEDLTFDQLQKLEYAEAVLNESFRNYNLVGAIERICTKDYPIPEMNFTIPKGMLVQVASFQLDAEHFPNPTTFNPENFTEESKQSRNPHAFHAFGQGPRNCIGMRFAIIQMKMVLVHMIKHFKVLECEKTPKIMDPDPMHPNQLPKGGLWVSLEPRN